VTKNEIARQMILIYSKRENRSTGDQLMTLNDLIEFAKQVWDGGYAAGLADRNEDAETTPIVEDVQDTTGNGFGPILGNFIHGR
jgi:hypothetical protein